MVTRQDPDDRQIFIQNWPMKVGSISEKLETAPFLWRPVPQTRIPEQGHTNGSTVHKIHGQRIITHADLLCTRLLLVSIQRTHAISNWEHYHYRISVVDDRDDRLCAGGYGARCVTLPAQVAHAAEVYAGHI